MTEDLQLKPIARQALDKAVEKAERYRLLNDPTQAESICYDILDLEPDNQRALVMLILSLTDQFASHEGSPGPKAAWKHHAKLTGAYERDYYAGIIHEREGRALLSRGNARMYAYDALREAMNWYQGAETNRPEGNDDAILRWNSCLRTIQREGLRPHVEKHDLPLE